MNLIFSTKMRYIIANKTLVQKLIPIDIKARRQDKSGRIMLNEKDLVGLSAITFTEKLAKIDGIEITEIQVIDKINKENWK